MIKRIAVVLALVAGSLVGIAATAAPSNATVSGSNCAGNYNNTTWQQVIVQSNTICRLFNSTVVGSVTVKKNAAFETCNDLIQGNVNATQAYVNIDSQTEIDGSLTLLKPGAQISAGDRVCNIDRGSSSYSSYICPHIIGGNLSITGMSSGYPTEVGDCGWVNIGGSFTIADNRLLVEAGYFSTGGSLVCVNNNPQPELFYPFDVGSQIIGCEVGGGDG